jgi:L-ascorbate metabolism protein UlaG (beta-lactamase superfamily)
MQITFLGHACFLLEDGGTRVLIDPFLSGNPKAATSADEVDPTHIFLTHGHPDHYGDVIDIARRTGAPVVAITELAAEIGEELGDGHEVLDPNLGGTVTFDWGWVKVVPAWHTSTSPKGTVNTPAGLVVNLGGKTIYHVGDTALFSDLQLIGHRAGPIDVALVPIGVRSSRATTTRSRRSRPTPRRSRPTSSAPRPRRSSSSSRAVPTACDARDRPHRGPA